MAAKKKAGKKPAGGPKAFIAKAPIRRLMKAEGAGLVAEEAVKILIDELVKNGAAVTKGAVQLVKQDKRKRVTAADISSAARK